MDITLALLFLAVGFAGGALFSQLIWARRLDRLSEQPPTTAESAAGPTVEVRISEDLIARYLASFNLVAVPRALVESWRESIETRH